jgi:hypothetical protein
MNKKISFIIIPLLLMLHVFFGTSQANAVNIYPDESVSSINVGEPTLVKIFIDTEGKEINSIEGFLKISGDVKISEVNTGGSVFNLWPEKPEIINNQEISFTGGTEGGVYGKNLRFLNFIITPISEGSIVFNPYEIRSYLNDGLGTKILYTNSSFKINAKQFNTDDKPSLEEDKNKPFPFNIELGHDQFLFNGKYFITFNATDSSSGIDKYQVKEGNLPFIDTDNSYVLKDQSLKTKVIVKAIDSAGNERVQEFNAGQMSIFGKILRYILLFVILYILYKIYKKIKS